MKSFGEGFVQPTGISGEPVPGSASYAIAGKGIVVLPPPQGTTLDGRQLETKPPDPRASTVLGSPLTPG